MEERFWGCIKIVLAFCLICLAALFVFEKIAHWQSRKSMVDDADRFITLKYEEVNIIVDTETGVQYLDGLSILVDTDGKPLLYKDEKSESETDSANLLQ